MNIQWQRPSSASSIYTGAVCDGLPLLSRGLHGLMDANLRDANDPAARLELNSGSPQSHVHGLRVRLSHHLVEDHAPNVQVLIAELRIENERAQPAELWLEFRSSARPGPSTGIEELHAPLTFNGLFKEGVSSALVGLGGGQRAEAVFTDAGNARLVFHYREPTLSDAESSTTPASLLIPLLDCGQRGQATRVAWFASPESGWRFAKEQDNRGSAHISLRTRIHVPAGGVIGERACLCIHEGGPEIAWKAFHALAHREEHPRIGWLDEVRVHYFDFLSPAVGDGGRRGGGFDESARHFREFQVGLATQHGYYSHWGDYLHPDRREWLAMRGDVHGPVRMSLEIMRARIAETRRQGSRAGVYLHLCGLDPCSPLHVSLADSVRVEADGRPTPFPWDGPDMEAPEASFMSIAAPAWSRHLLQQAAWIMELLDPDAIVMDETFAGTGYDFHPDRRGPTSSAMIAFMRAMRSLLRSYGPDKAFLTSDCGLSTFVLWADGEGGDHIYGHRCGHPLYLAEPVRCLSSLGDKPWIPCGWHWQQYWDSQVELSRKTGAAIAVANGWIDYAGLGGLNDASRRRYLADLRTLEPIWKQRAARLRRS